jgi:hypothetical protein
MGVLKSLNSVRKHGRIIQLKFLMKSPDENYDCFMAYASSCKLASVCCCKRMRLTQARVRCLKYFLWKQTLRGEHTVSMGTEYGLISSVEFTREIIFIKKSVLSSDKLLNKSAKFTAGYKCRCFDYAFREAYCCI